MGSPALLRQAFAWLTLVAVHPVLAQSNGDLFSITRLESGVAEVAVTFWHPGPPGTQVFSLQHAVSLDAPWQVVDGAGFAPSAGGGVFTVPWDGVGAGYFRVAAVPVTGSIPELLITEVATDNETGLQDADGDFPDWVELFNAGDAPLSLAGLALSDDGTALGKWAFPDVALEPGGYLVVFLSGKDRAGPGEFHAGFQVRNGEESLFLSLADGRVIDRIDAGPLDADASLGRGRDDLSLWFPQDATQATPGAANTAFPGGAPEPYLEPPRFSVRGGVYGEPVDLVLEAPLAGGEIRFTLDGQEPVHSPTESNSAPYTAPLAISAPTVIRARVFAAGGGQSRAKTMTYIVGAQHQLPVVALATDPENFEFKNGYLYGMGRAVSSTGRVNGTFPYSSSNAWLDREAPVNFEFYEPDNRDGLNVVVGAKIFGGWGSRGYPQKSMALFARREYGFGRIRYPLFPDSGVDSFESLVLRNSGNDNQSTHLTAPRAPITAFSAPQGHGSYFVNGTYTLFRDALVQSLVRETGLDTQAYRPVVVYLNGDYWGIYNLREKLTEHYVASHHGVDSGQVDLIEGYGTANAGSASGYNAMRSFIGGRDMADPANYEVVMETHLDIDNFIDYHLAVIYCQNFDIGNIKCWRARQGEDRRFRWMLYDQDYGFGLWPASVYEPAMARDYADYRNMFTFYTNPSGSGTGWPNEGGRTLLLRRLLANPEFFDRFVNRCAELLNTLFEPGRVVGRIDQLADTLRPEIPAHLARWSWEGIQARGFGLPHKPEDDPLTLAQWESHVEVARAFARGRPAQLREDLVRHFGLTGGLADLAVEVPATGEGAVRAHTVTPDALPWSGRFFADYPPEIAAVPAPGFAFEAWVGDVPADTPGTFRPELARDATFTIRPVFAPVEVSDPSHLAITVSEVHYHPSPADPAGEWIEIRNRGAAAVDLADWALYDSDDAHRFALPPVELAPGGNLVVCADPEGFAAVHGDVADCAGPLGFSLSNGGDRVRVIDSGGALVVDFNYSDDNGWPQEPDGGGPSLERVGFDHSPDSPGAWAASAEFGGTPGR
jgi:hypothetical protein